MAKVVVIYGEKSKIPRRVISGEHPDRWKDHVGPGEALHVVDMPEDTPLEMRHVSVIHGHFYNHHGISPENIPDPRCALVAPSGMVVNVIMADPLIDTHPDGAVISIGDKAVAINDKWDGEKFLDRYAVVEDGKVIDFYWAAEPDPEKKSVRDSRSNIGDVVEVSSQ